MLIIGDLQIDEDIDNFWASLDDEDRNWSKKEEEYSREELGFKVLTDEQQGALLSTKKTEGKTLQGTHSYDILAN